MSALKINVTDKNIQNLIVIASDKDVLTDNNGNVDVSQYLDAYAVYDAKKDTKKERVHASLEENTDSILEYLGFNEESVMTYQDFKNGNLSTFNLQGLMEIDARIKSLQLIENSDEDIVYEYKGGEKPVFKLSWWVNEDAYYETAKLIDDSLTTIDDDMHDEDNPFELTNVASVIVVAEDKSHTLLTMEEAVSFKFKSCDDNELFSELINDSVFEVLQNGDMYFVRAEYDR